MNSLQSCLLLPLGLMAFLSCVVAYAASPPDLNARLKELAAQSATLEVPAREFTAKIDSFIAQRSHPDEAAKGELSPQALPYALKDEHTARKLLEILRSYGGTPPTTQLALNLVLGASASQDHPDPEIIFDIAGAKWMSVLDAYRMLTESALSLRLDKSFRLGVQDTFAHFMRHENQGPSQLIGAAINIAVLEMLSERFPVANASYAAALKKLSTDFAQTRAEIKERNKAYFASIGDFERARPDKRQGFVPIAQDEMRFSTLYMKRVESLLSDYLYLTEHP